MVFMHCCPSLLLIICVGANLSCCKNITPIAGGESVPAGVNSPDQLAVSSENISPTKYNVAASNNYNAVTNGYNNKYEQPPALQSNANNYYNKYEQLPVQSAPYQNQPYYENQDDSTDYASTMSVESNPVNTLNWDLDSLKDTLTYLTETQRMLVDSVQAHQHTHTDNIQRSSNNDDNKRAHKVDNKGYVQASIRNYYQQQPSAPVPFGPAEAPALPNLPFGNDDDRKFIQNLSTKQERPQQQQLQESPLLQPFSAIRNLFSAKTQQAQRNLRRLDRQRRLRRLRRLRNLQRNLRRGLSRLGLRRPQRRQLSRRPNTSRHVARLEEVRSQRIIVFIKNTFFDAVWTALVVIGVKLIPLLLLFVKHLFGGSTSIGVFGSIFGDSVEPFEMTDDDFLDIPQRLNAFDKFTSDDDSLFDDKEEDDIFGNDNNNQNDFQFDSVDQDDVDIELDELEAEFGPDRSILGKLTGLSNDFSSISQSRRYN